MCSPTALNAADRAKCADRAECGRPQLNVAPRVSKGTNYRDVSAFKYR
jgi:hypothetical protein